MRFMQIVYNKIFGRLVGKDTRGNLYYLNRAKSRRWIFNEKIALPQAEGDWHSWLYYQIDNPPAETKAATDNASKANSSLNSSSERRYTSWCEKSDRDTDD